MLKRAILAEFFPVKTGIVSVCLLMVIFLFQCSPKEKQTEGTAVVSSAHVISLPVLGDFSLAALKPDSVHGYGMGDCSGQIVHFSGAEVFLAVDSMICSEYSFRFSHYLMSRADLLKGVYRVDWVSSMAPPDFNSYEHILTESVYLMQPLRKMVRVDTLDQHYLASGGYPPTIRKDFTELDLSAAEFEKLDFEYRATWHKEMQD